MIPSVSYFPYGLQNRVAWYQNYNTHAQAEGMNFGLTQANLDQIKDDNAVMQMLGVSAVALDAYDKSWTAYRNVITTGAIGEPTPDYPTAPIIAFPVAVPTGIYQRIVEYRAIVMASLGYTPELGESWGIEPSTPQPISPITVKPTISVHEAETGYHFSIVVGKRAQADSWRVMVYRKGASGWTLAETATGKSADVHLIPQTLGEPEQLQVRTQLRKNNEDYGQLSDTVWVTINP